MNAMEQNGRVQSVADLPDLYHPVKTSGEVDGVAYARAKPTFDGTGAPVHDLFTYFGHTGFREFINLTPAARVAKLKDLNARAAAYMEWMALPSKEHRVAVLDSVKGASDVDKPEHASYKLWLRELFMESRQKSGTATTAPASLSSSLADRPFSGPAWFTSHMFEFTHNEQLFEMMCNRLTELLTGDSMPLMKWIYDASVEELRAALDTTESLSSKSKVDLEDEIALNPLNLQTVVDRLAAKALALCPLTADLNKLMYQSDVVEAKPRDANLKHLALDPEGKSDRRAPSIPTKRWSAFQKRPDPSEVKPGKLSKEEANSYLEFKKLGLLLRMYFIDNPIRSGRFAGAFTRTSKLEFDRDVMESIKRSPHASSFDVSADAHLWVAFFHVPRDRSHDTESEEAYSKYSAFAPSSRPTCRRLMAVVLTDDAYRYFIGVRTTLTELTKNKDVIYAQASADIVKSIANGTKLDYAKLKRAQAKRTEALELVDTERFRTYQFFKTAEDVTVVANPILIKSVSFVHDTKTENVPGSTELKRVCAVWADAPYVASPPAPAPSAAAAPTSAHLAVPPATTAAAAGPPKSPVLAAAPAPTSATKPAAVPPPKSPLKAAPAAAPAPPPRSGEPETAKRKPEADSDPKPAKRARIVSDAPVVASDAATEVIRNGISGVHVATQTSADDERESFRKFVRGLMDESRAEIEKLKGDAIKAIETAADANKRNFLAETSKAGDQLRDQTTTLTRDYTTAVNGIVESALTSPLKAVLEVVHAIELAQSKSRAAMAALPSRIAPAPLPPAPSPS